MTKDQLLESARQLKQPANTATEEYSSKRGQLVAEIDKIMLSRPDLVNLIGNDNQAMMQDNHQNHAQFMESMFTSFQPEVLVETVIWVFKAYRSHQFHSTYWSAQLNTWQQVLEKGLTPESYKEIQPFYHWMIVNIPVFSKLRDASED